ncbi:class I SAM-dependent methyltransferase [Sphaerisporangium sp. TRM90804]|uniref:class I SAM-dependent methyltransferase n=1 Tax=Sphaerisporangium sp. TRM90804 TaxID=3031113 RepID=UPI00244D511F|nr:class I SAM-dependent methyltransferase [Sphaerisporangium sp. TRM90804]MDH2427923.1 class I SAM-dependent methyltransferase [Sphaerisporangium sp. TRM90804]
MTARYEGHAEWYDDYIGTSAADNVDAIVQLLGPGKGLCLDVGCGTGLYLDALRSTGRTVVGLDRAADQLRLARRRDRAPLLQGDATTLPFAAGTFGTVAALWVSTDVGDFAGLLREAARVLLPGGSLLFYGVHPCFNGPHIEPREDGAMVIHPTYRIKGWHDRAPWWRPGGVRDRVGMSQVPLPDLINAFIDAGLSIDRVYEPREHPIPYVLAVKASRRNDNHRPAQPG